MGSSHETRRAGFRGTDEGRHGGGRPGNHAPLAQSLVGHGYRSDDDGSSSMGDDRSIEPVQETGAHTGDHELTIWFG